jgi:hypothetical protein
VLPLRLFYDRVFTIACAPGLFWASRCLVRSPFCHYSCRLSKELGRPNPGCGCYP